MTIKIIHAKSEDRSLPLFSLTNPLSHRARNKRLNLMRLAKARQELGEILQKITKS